MRQLMGRREARVGWCGSAIGMIAGMASVLGYTGCHDRGPAAAPEVAAHGASANASHEATDAAHGAAADASHDRALAALHAFEDQRRAATDFARVPSSDQILGPDPYRIAALHGGATGVARASGGAAGARLIGLLRGESAVVALDGDGAELARLAAPRSPSGLAVWPDGAGADDVLVVGEAARELAHYRVEGGRLARAAALPVDALGLRDVALAPDGKTAYLVEDHDGRLLAVALERDRARGLRAAGVRELARCHGPIQVAAAGDYVAVDCLLDHTIELRRVGGEPGRAGGEPGRADGEPMRAGGEPVRIHHDGPLWRFALAPQADGGVLVAAGGVEDHPLEREDGGFGYIDSYLYLYRVAPGAQPVRLAAINTSELGVVTPKWVALRADADVVAVTAAGYASPSVVTATWRAGDLAAPPRIAQIALLPGTADAQLTGDGTIVAANPLFDAWVVARAGALGEAGAGPRGGPGAGAGGGVGTGVRGGALDPAPRVVAVVSTQPARSAMSRIGELLFFTTLMAPWNSADGKLSRFTCETCHHEGYVDGRTHFTGRGQVYATTRPLYGLGNDRPFFSRALDKTMTQMVHAEFRVANRHNGRDPWFALTRADVPWLAEVAGIPAELSPAQLREAFMTFLMDFTHRANPAVIDRIAADPSRPPRFTALERAGAQVFRDRCAGCHAARLVADDPGSVVPFERWEALVLSAPGPIVWSNAAYARTGVTPYVGDSGARVPPLRRLYKKWPYFTNGHARSLDDVLERFAFSVAPAVAGARSPAVALPVAGAPSPGDTAYHDAAPDAAVRLPPDEKPALRAFLDLL
ncbi:MAG TPA: hypothetical protein VH165_17350 [Kofleriaceae bacterium]|nr:hypothetical protein [Kofleriaceae bacterium]